MANHGKPLPAPVAASQVPELMWEGNILDNNGLPSSIADTIPDIDTRGAGTFDSRAYQLEMLEESIKRNIIVAVIIYVLGLYRYISLTVFCARWIPGAAKRMCKIQ